MGKISRVRMAVEDLNPFAHGCLVTLETRCWQAAASLPNRFFGDKMPKDIVRANFDTLVNKGDLEEIQYYMGEAKSFVHAWTIPCPTLRNLEFVPKHTIVRINDGLVDRKRKVLSLVDEFIDHRYDGLKKVFMEKHPHLYNPKQYPDKSALRKRFQFDWKFRQFEPPSNEMGILPPEVYEDELRKFQKETKAMRDQCVGTVAQVFIDKINKIKDQCADGKVYPATIDSANKFLDKFTALWEGFIGHDQLANLINECKVYMEGTDASMLKADDEFRGLVGRKMEAIAKEFEKVADERMTRMLDL